MIAGPFHEEAGERQLLVALAMIRERVEADVLPAVAPAYADLSRGIERERAALRTLQARIDETFRDFDVIADALGAHA